MLDGVMRVARDLGQARCQRVWLDGSFVTTKEFPADFDLCYDLATTEIDELPAVLLDPASAKRVYGGDIFPTHPALSFISFFQRDRDGHLKGIIQFDPRSVR